MKIKLNQISALRSRIVLVLLLAIFGATFAVAPIVQADQFDQQIQQLQDQNNQNQSAVNSLQSQASSYQDAINQLQSQINGLQAAIAANQAKQADLQKQIADAQAELDKERQVLGESIRAMYVEGQISTLEMLASSKNLSDFVDKQEYRNSVQDKLKQTLDKVTALKQQLQDQKNQLDVVVKSEQQQNAQLASDQSQQQQLLAYNEGQQATYNQQIQSNQAQIASLRAQQAAANRKLLGSGSISASGSCGGSYPADAINGYGGHWGCNYGKDNTFDNWGMLNRECVSYTAWMVYHTYGYMPYWGGSGNANQWPGDAQAAGIPTGSTPKVGSVAISMSGAYGHAMWVTGVSGNTIHVQQYNYDLQGNYSEMTINGSGLVYIYFGG